VSDIFFAFVAFMAVACFGALITLQVLEKKFYEDPMAPFGGSIWAVTQTMPVR